MGVERSSVAKITRPALTGCYPRVRLFRALNRELKRRILWVSGPPGSGKTTLIGSYVAARKLPCIWYQVDPRDGDVATCFYYLGLAARKAAPRNRKSLPLLTPEYLPGLQAFSRRFFEALFSRLASPGIIVFDDCHEVPADAPFHGVVAEGLSLLPKGIRAFLISRGPPPGAFSRFLANREMEEFGSDDLRFNPVETKGMLDRSGYESLNRETLRDLHEKAGGWAAGIAVLMREHRRGKVTSRPRILHTPQAIFDYFASQIFELQEPEIRCFLLKSAFLPRMTEKMAERMTGWDRAGQSLSHLHRHNCFTEVLPDHGTVYRYHQLFREFLLSRAEEDLTGDEIHRLRRAAAAILAESGFWEDAIEPMRDSEDLDGFVRMILSQAPVLSQQGRGQTLLDLLGMVPEDRHDRNPWLLFWEGVGRFPLDPVKSQAAFERAFELFSRAEDVGGAFLSWSRVVDAILFRWNDFRPLDRWIDWLDRRIAEGTVFPSVEIEARVSASMSGALLRRRPHHPDIRAWVDRALSASRAVGDENLKLQSMVHAANYHHWTGDRAAVSLAGEEIRILSRSPAASPGYAIYGLSIEASTLLWAEADIAGALRVVAEGLDATRRLGVPQWDHLFFAAGAYAALLAGDMKLAGEYLGKVKTALPASRRFGECQYDHLCAWHHISRGDAQGAVAHTERALANAVSTGAVLPEILFRITAANIAEGLGEHEKAKTLLLGAGDGIRSSGNRIFEFMERLTAARIAFGSGEDSAGWAALREGMELGRSQGYVNLFWWWEPAEMARLCLKALDAGIEVVHVRELIRRNRLVPDPSSPDLEKWPWPVKVYTFGRFSLIIDGKVLPPSRKTRQKPLLLLKALIALGGREVPEERLGELLWPEADGDLAHQSLAKTLGRLREMLGDDRTVPLHDGRLTLNNRYCWVDVWEFERMLGRADAARKPGARLQDSGEVVRLTERAIALYGGTFLTGEAFCSCIVTQRERLRSKFLRAIVQAGRHWEQAGEWGKAIDCYQKGLEVDPLSEEMCRGLIVCNLRTGRAPEAHAVYQRCCRTLSSVLGVSPSPDLQAILKSAPVTLVQVKK